MSTINTSGSVGATPRDTFNSNVGTDLHKPCLCMGDTYFRRRGGKKRASKGLIPRDTPFIPQQEIF
ncbi:MAG: hypothetical protein V2A65_11025 [Candidatus Omnitrophota bacterium]